MGIIVTGNKFDLESRIEQLEEEIKILKDQRDALLKEREERINYENELLRTQVCNLYNQNEICSRYRDPAVNRLQVRPAFPCTFQKEGESK